MLRVTSRQNSRVKQLRAAFADNLRLSDGLVALEGTHLITEALRSGLQLDAIFVREGREALLPDSRLHPYTPTFLMEKNLFDSAVATESPQGIAALLRVPEASMETLLQATAPQLVLIAAGLQDPGNLGTLLRSAEAFAASGVLCLPGTVGTWNQKTIRASAGSVLRMTAVRSRSQEDVLLLRKAGIQIFAAVADRGLPLHTVDLTAPCALLIGNEGAGLSAEQLTLADTRITIPCPGPVESLNAAVAGSLLLYEATRQRQAKSGHA